jgi:peptidoglycan/xylan/chitin deacetylase (PgdA/CDA1 family)
MPAGTVFLMYHELELPGRSPVRTEPGYLRYVLRESDFRAQLYWLQRTGWRAMSVGEALTCSPQREVALTFDDGCETDLTTAAPLLKAVGYRATFYVTVEFLGKRGYLSRIQLCELSALGFEIGCHSMTHPYLNDLGSQELHREIVEAKRELEQLLSKSVNHFSCPGGRYDQRVVKIAREAGYQSLATSESRANSPSSDRFLLGRVSILRDMPLGTFQELCRGEGLWKLRVRDSMRNAAKTIMGNPGYDRIRALLVRNSQQRVLEKSIKDDRNQ